LETQKIVGGDALPFGVEANRPTLDALIQYAYSQKIIPARVQPEAIFFANALEQ
jgi:4,5-dihydroxyphthalate decarboxylase